MLIWRGSEEARRERTHASRVMWEAGRIKDLVHEKVWQNYSGNKKGNE